MTLELLYVIRDYNIHLQGHQYQIMQVIYVSIDNSLRNVICFIRIQRNWFFKHWDW